MVMNNDNSVFHNLSLLCSLLFLSYFSQAYGIEETLANRPHHHQHVIRVKSLLPATSCSEFSPRGKKASKLPIFNKNGPCSPWGNKQKPLNHTEILIQDQGRIHSIQSRIPKGGVHSIDSMAATLPVNSGNSLGTGNFIVTIGFGTPKRDLPIIFDTGSDLTWIQCQPCVGGCYSQLDPIFDPSYSSSYTNISCTSIDCAQVQSGTSNIPGCSSSTCVYGITYGDQSYSYGFFAEETLTVTPSDVFPKFQFGCGEQNNGLFGEAAGLLGLGRDNISFVSQTSQKYNKSFSYCIPSGSSSGFLAFGAPNSTASSSTLSNSTAAKFTPLLTDSRGPSFYFLDLQGISVGATKLAISPSTFNLSGTIIDSGTVITRLPPLAYSALRTAFQQAMASYPAAPAMSVLDTCYDFSGFQTVNVPKIVLHFANETDLDVDFSGIFYASNVYQVCLAFAGNTDAKETAVIGNWQQQTVEVVYDVGGGKLGFAPGGCS